MVALRKSKRLVLAVATIVVLAATVLLLAPPPAAAACTHGATRWVQTSTCCLCNHGRISKLQFCNSSGAWVDTGTTDCFFTQTCCKLPCCV